MTVVSLKAVVSRERTGCPHGKSAVRWGEQQAAVTATLGAEVYYPAYQMDDDSF